MGRVVSKDLKCLTEDLQNRRKGPACSRHLPGPDEFADARHGAGRRRPKSAV